MKPLYEITIYDMYYEEFISNNYTPQLVLPTKSSSENYRKIIYVIKVKCGNREIFLITLFST